MNSYQRRHIRYCIKRFLKCFIFLSFILFLFFLSFDYGQSKVDKWERDSGRYGEGLR